MDLGTKKRKRTDDEQGQKKRSKITNTHLYVRSYLTEIVSHLQFIVDKINVSTYQQNDLEMAFLEQVENFYTLLSQPDYKNEQAIDILGNMYGCVAGIIKVLPSTEKQEDKPVVLSRFAAVDTTPVVSLSAEYLKLNRMIELFCIKRSHHAGVSQSLGATYSALSEYPVAKENLFFTLEAGGFKVYASCLDNLQALKLYLESMGFNELMCTTEATAPSVPGFERHQQYIIISHLQVGKLLALHSRKEKPQIALRDIYRAKKLDPVKCRFFATRAKVFEEMDADFYKNCFKNLQKKNNGQKFELLNNLIEDTQFNEMDHRRYLLALLEVQQKFLALPHDQKILLPKELYQALIGLRSQLILAENDESAGLSKRLSRHFHQVYDIDQLDAKAPFVLFTQEGCCFYLDSQAAAKQLEEQFTIHGLTCHLALDERDLRQFIHQVNSDDYPHKLVVKPCSNRELLKLGRIHPANIDIALKQAYGNQKLDFISVLLSAAANGDRPPIFLAEEKMVAPQSSTGFIGFSWFSTLMSSPTQNTIVKEKVQLSYQTAILKNGEKIIELNLQTPAQQNHQNMGEVLLVLDNSGSMSGQKIEAAKQACINLIQELPLQAQITLWTFNQTPIFDGVLKSNLPYNWQKSILSIVADKSTPLVETITQVGAKITPNRSFVPLEKLKEVLLVILTDGEGDHQETAEEVLYALKTGMFRKQDVSRCNHSLGTPLLPNHSTIPTISIGIGTGYKSAFVNGLGNFAGSYHIRDDENMHNDLFEMTEKVKKTFGKKIGPIYAGLMQDGQPIFTVCKDMMLPGSAQCQYIKISGEFDLSKLQACSFVNNDFNSEILVETQNNQHVLEAYFKSMMDKLFNELANQVNAQASSATFGQADRFARSTLPVFAPTTNEQSIYQSIKDKLAQLEQEMKDNDVFDLCPSLQQEVVCFKEMILKAEQSRIDQDDWRRRQAQVTRGERFSDELDNTQTQNKNKFGIF